MSKGKRKIKAKGTYVGCEVKFLDKDRIEPHMIFIDTPQRNLVVYLDKMKVEEY